MPDEPITLPLLRVLLTAGVHIRIHWMSVAMSLFTMRDGDIMRRYPALVDYFKTHGSGDPVAGARHEIAMWLRDIAWVVDDAMSCCARGLPPNGHLQVNVLQSTMHPTNPVVGMWLQPAYPEEMCKERLIAWVETLRLLAHGDHTEQPSFSAHKTLLTAPTAEKAD